MKLKRLEIIGFKSFMDKVSLDFSDGISAIVGPNGCGKSNIVDAIRWVMGEQNARLLRGKKMEDVIFNGSEQAAPVNMSEVSLVMVNDGTGFPGNYSECHEVNITRRVFREGESEYLINGVPCRLLDVREFFMDTGIGSRAYSLIEQNSVSGMVEAKPEDRRRYIEEAAGIVKYKSRKEAAIRKMESTRENLTRLNDIFREVKSQLNSISRQAKRAEKYKSLKQELKEAEISLALQNYSSLLGKEKDLKQTRDELLARADSIRAELENRQSNLDEFKVELLAGNNRISSLQDNIYKVKSEISSREQQIELSRVRLTQLAQQKEKLIAELKTIREQRKEIQEEITTLKFSLDNSEGDTAGIRDNISRLQLQADQLRASETEIYRDYENRKIKHVDILTENARIRNALSSILKSIEDLRKRSEKDSRELDEIRKSIESSRTNSALAGEGLDRDSEKLRELISLEECLVFRTGELDDLFHELGEKVQECREDIGSKSSRLHSLTEFQEEFLWCQEGTRSIMKSYRERGFTCEGLYGLVADHIDVPSHCETAVEAVLGEKLQYVITKSQEDGIRAIDFLKSKSNGRGSFIPMEVRTNGSNKGTLPEGAQRILDLVNIKDNFEGIAECLLGDVYLIPDLPSAVGLWKKNGFQGTLVTPEGDIVNPHGILTGGKGGNGDAGLLKNKRDISELEKEIAEITRELNHTLDRREETKSEIAESEQRLKELRSSVRELELKMSSSKKDLERFDNELKWLGQRESVLAFSRENLEKEETESNLKIAEFKEKLSALEISEQQTGAEISGGRQKWESIRRELEETERQLTEQKVLYASVEEKRESATQSVLRLEAALAQTAREIDSREVELNKGDALSAEIAEKTKADQEQIHGIYSQCALLESELEKHREEQKLKEEGLSGREQEIQEARRSLDLMNTQANEKELGIRETGYQINALQNTVSERYSESIENLVSGFQMLSEEQVRENEQTLERLRKTVEEFGEVNLLALSEFEQQKERHDFLSAQIADLNASLDALQRTIARINRVSRQRFAETFEAVNACFREVFPQMFPGGKGELRLTDESDMLETGVDIHLQIPGKRAQNVTLLSGGEKSMAAVALIFAILMFRPTPFSILDEVDAALDDANVNLFNNMLKNISNRSQIVLITHNKATMEVADNLFGVTMEKQGISKLVSVTIN